MAPRCTLLMITYNRRDYTATSLQRLLECEGDFAVWVWDNGSQDGCAELVSAFSSHPRVERVHLSPDNVMQSPPFEWLLTECRSPIIGKVDDDCLFPRRWVEPIGDAVLRHDRLGAVGCWTFWPDDFIEQSAAHKIRRFGDIRVVSNAYVGGTGVLLRRQIAQRFFAPRPTAIPIEYYRMSASGLVNGWHYPLIWAEHMDDPRSRHCLLRRPEGMSGTFALTAKRRNHRSPQEYEQWIRQDCATLLGQSTAQQLRAWRLDRLRSVPRRAARSIKRWAAGMHRSEGAEQTSSGTAQDLGRQTR